MIQIEENQKVIDQGLKGNKYFLEKITTKNR